MADIAWEYSKAVIENWWNLTYILLLAFYQGAPMVRKTGFTTAASRYAIFVRKPVVKFSFLALALIIFLGVNFSAYYDAKIGLRQAEATRDAVLEKLVDKPVLVGIRYSQTRIPSTNPEFPYGLKVVVQTDKTIQLSKIVLAFDGDVGYGDFSIADVGMYHGSAGVGIGRPNIFLAQLKSPEIKPETPMIFKVYSKSAIKVINFATQ